MRIGIDASRAFLKRRTGIEEYSYQVIRHLRTALPETVSVILYTRPFQHIDISLPSHWEVKRLTAPRFWTQVRLSYEMLRHAPDVLFVPAHTIPFIHPRRTIVTIHGLEYEECPEAYSLWERLYMRISIRFSTGVAERIIAVSPNTKDDLVRRYGIAQEKISVVAEGYDEALCESAQQTDTYKPHIPYFFFIGRLETRKNLVRLIQAYTLFRDQSGLPHQLVLAGKPGYGSELIIKERERSRYRDDILFIGYVDTERKKNLIGKAEAFVFPSLYEGFGLPILEAQVLGAPVITANSSSLPSVGGFGAVYVDPLDVSALAEAMIRIASNRRERADIIEKGTYNKDRFSWEKCAREIAQIIMDEH